MELQGYDQIELIGEGGLGRVYRARRISTGGLVAIKELRDISEGSPAWHRARRELEALLRLKGHPYVVNVEEVVQGAGGPCLIMEYAAGGSLMQHLASGPLSGPELVVVGQHVCEALGAAHALGIIHRDIKPHNLLIGAFGQVKVCDFGIASLVRDGDVRTKTGALTMAYASPEELDDDDDIGPAADVYSFGATMMHLATGKRPSFRDRVEGNTVGFGTQEPALSGVVAVLRRTMAHDPADRPTIAELSEAFDAAATQLGARRVRVLGVGSPVAGDEPAIRANSPAAVAAPPTEDIKPTVVRPQPLAPAQTAPPPPPTPPALADTGDTVVRAPAPVHAATDEVPPAVQFSPPVSPPASPPVSPPAPPPVSPVSPSAGAPAGPARRRPGLLVAATVGVLGVVGVGVAVTRGGNDDGSTTPTATEVAKSGVTTASTDPATSATTPDSTGTTQATTTQATTATTVVAARRQLAAVATDTEQGVDVGQAFSPDGRRMVTVGLHSFRITDTASTQILVEVEAHTGVVSDAVFSPDGSRIATISSDDAHAKVWDASTGQLIATTSDITGAGTFVEFSPDGSMILTGSLLAGTMVWDASTGAFISILMTPQDQTVWASEFFPDSTRVLTFNSNAFPAPATVTIWDARTGAVIRSWDSTPDLSASVSPDGNKVVTGSFDAIAVFDANSGTLLWDTKLAMTDTMHFDPSGQFIVGRSSDYGAAIWSATDGSVSPEICCFGDGITRVRFSPDGRSIVTASRDGRVRLFHADTLQEYDVDLDAGAISGIAYAAAFSPDGRWVVATFDGGIAWWDVSGLS